MALFGALLLVFVILIRPQEFIPGLEAMHILHVAIVLAALGVLVEVGTGQIKYVKAPNIPLLAMFWIWTFFSTTIAAGIHAATDLRINLPIFFMLLVQYGVTSYKALRTMTAMLLGIMVIICYVAAAQALNPKECIRFTGERASAGVPLGIPCETHHDCVTITNDYKSDFGCERVGPLETFSVAQGRVRWRGILADPNEMSMALGAMLAFAFAFHASAKGAMRHVFLIAAAGLVTFCVIRSGSRGGVLVLLAIFGTYFVRAYGPKGLILAVMFGAPILLLGGRKTEEAESSSEERLGALYTAATFIKEHPLFGLGCGQFTENYFITAHNSYALCTSELGFPGLVCFSSLLYVSIKVPYTIATKPTPDMDRRLIPFAIALVTSFAGLMVGIFFLSFCYNEVLYIYFALSGGMYLAAKRSSPSFNVKVGPKDIGLVACLDLLLVFVIFGYTRMHGPP